MSVYYQLTMKFPKYLAIGLILIVGWFNSQIIGSAVNGSTPLSLLDIILFGIVDFGAAAIIIFLLFREPT